MNERCDVRKFRVTRWHQFIFPEEVIIDNMRVLSRKRKFPAFWIVKEESIPLRSVASVQINRGLLFSSIMIENSGGPYPIQLRGIPNKNAREIRQLVENYSGPTQSTVKVETAPPVVPRKVKKATRSTFKAFAPQPAVVKKTNSFIIEPAEEAWNCLSLDPMESVRKFDEKKTETVKSEKHFVNAEKFKSKRELDDELEESLSTIPRNISPKKRVRNIDPNHLPTIDEALYESDSKSKSEWMKDLVSPPSKQK